MEVVVTLIILVVVIAILVWAIQPKPTPRKEMTVTLIREEKESEMLVYRVDFAAVTDAAPDAVKRIFRQNVDGTPADPIELPLSAAMEEVSYKQGSQVTLSLSRVDDAGNEGEAQTIDFTAADTIPPGAATGMTITLLREEPDPVEPPVDPEPPAA